MTTPTSIQIEEAARAMRYIDSEKYPENWYMTLAEAALTAAAEVDRGAQTGKSLTGNLNEVSLGENSESVLHRHTIERCAQVVESLNPHDDRNDHIAAAIRALAK